jgi:subfamily B ATP-binding cassette protein MsbA
MKLKIFRPLDRRLVADLKTQKRTITLGLVCVILTSLLSSSTILLIERSVRSIQNASARSEQTFFERHELRTLSERLGKDQDEVNNVLEQLAAEKKISAERIFSEDEQHELSLRLHADENQLQAALEAIAAERARTRQTPDEALRSLGFFSLLIVAVFIVKYWFTRGQIYYLSKAAIRIGANIRKRLFDKLMRLPVSYFNEKRAGGIYSVLTNDVNVYQNAVTLVRDSIDAPVRALTSIAVIIWIQWQLALVALLATPFMFMAIQRNARKMKRAQADVQDDLAELGAMGQEALMGARVVKAFGAENQIGGQYAKLVETTYGSQMRAVRRLASLRPLVEVIGAVALAGVLYICGFMAKNGSLQLSHIAALLYALDLINQGFRSYGYVQNSYAQVQAASERIYSEVLDVPEHQVDDPKAETIDNPQGKIEFIGVSFTYPDGTKALDNVSFTLEPGSSLALVGPSGAGKSTIADLLLRFYDPTEGAILFDGKDIRTLKVAWLREQIGVVPQHTFLFAGPISENIRLGSPDATDEEIAEAARAAHALFIEQMPQRYETPLGESGAGLSGGEKQRIAIARAFVRKPTVLLLDEATSNLDAVSERAVQEALEEIMRERTTLFIAHRLTTAARADKILVLRRGEVVECGSHQALMKLDGAYAAMYQAFSSGVVDEIG